MSWTRRKKLLSACELVGKRKWETACASGFPGELEALPSITVFVGDAGSQRPVRALVDTGCTQTLISSRLVQNASKSARSGVWELMAVDGSVVSCDKVTVSMTINDTFLAVPCYVMTSLLAAFDLILGMDVIERLGGLRLCCGDGSIQFGLAARRGETEQEELVVDDVDFSARFDGSKWSVRWKWSNCEPNLSNTISCYRVRPDIKQKFDEEVESWIKEGILAAVPDSVKVTYFYPASHGCRTRKQE